MSIIGSLPYNLTNGQVADATQVMADFNTVVNAINNSSTGAASIPGVQASSYNYAADTGTVNAPIVGINPSPAVYTDGLSVTTKAANTNTSGTMTVKFGSLGTKSLVVDQAGTLPPIGSYILGMHYRLEYDSTQDKVILMNPSTASGSFTGTLNGYAVALTPTVNYMKTGDNKSSQAWISSPAVSTSNAVTMTMTGIPNELVTATSKFIMCRIEDATASTFGGFDTGTANTWTYHNGAVIATNTFTASGQKGLPGTPSQTFSIPLP